MSLIYIMGNTAELSALFEKKIILENGICVNMSIKKVASALTEYIKNKLISQQLSFVPNAEIFSAITISAKPIQNILSKNKSIDVDGYMHFRLCDEKKKIKTVVDKIISDYQAELKCQELIGSLREYVLENSSRESVIQIIPSENQTYTILDSLNNDITFKSLINFSRESILENYINYDDMLFSTLLDLLPQKVVVHGFENICNKNIFATITKLFKVQII